MIKIFCDKCGIEIKDGWLEKNELQKPIKTNGENWNMCAKCYELFIQFIREEQK